MNGAVQAGLRAAAEVLEILRPQALCSEDFGALEGSRPVTKPAIGLSKPRWMLKPRRGGHQRGTNFFRWTIAFCVVVGLGLMAKKNNKLQSFFRK